MDSFKKSKQVFADISGDTALMTSLLPQIQFALDKQRDAWAFSLFVKFHSDQIAKKYQLDEGLIKQALTTVKYLGRHRDVYDIGFVNIVDLEFVMCRRIWRITLMHDRSMETTIRVDIIDKDMSCYARDGTLDLEEEAEIETEDFVGNVTNAPPEHPEEFTKRGLDPLVLWPIIRWISTVLL